ncbi:unnamed protein product [Rhizophagus irregularis]|nr:unnamed protein product [Rhizophagus irregularis]
MNLNHKSQLQLPSQSLCLTLSTSSDKITSSSSSYTNDFSVSISDELLINNGDEYYQTAISLFCFIEENNKDPTDI